MSGFSGVAKSIALFLIVEFLILLVVLVMYGAFASGPLQFVIDIAASAGTTVDAIAIAFFIFGTIANLILMFVIAIRG